MNDVTEATDTITMVIPTYRRARLLRRAILSVLNQSYPHVRVSVYDNASGDDTEQVVRDLMRRDARVGYHRHPENIGTYKNFNYGILNVRTPFFTVMSDDDILAPAFYEKAMAALKAYPGAMLACMPTMTVDDALNVIEAPIEVERTVYYEAGAALRGTVKGEIPGSKWSGILFRTAVRDQIGHPNAAAGPFADAGYLWRVVARFPVVVLPGVAALYMVHPHNMGTEVRMTPMDGGWPAWWEKMIEAVEKDPEVPPPVRAEVREIVYPDFRSLGIQQVVYFLGAGRPDLARRAAIGLGSCGYRILSAALRMLVWSNERVPPLRWAYSGLIRLRHRKTKARWRQLHAKYGEHAAFARALDTDAEPAHV